MTHSRLRLRLIASTAAISALAIAAAAGALVIGLQHAFDRTIASQLSARSAAVAAAVVRRGTIPDVPGADDALFDSPSWVFDQQGRLVEGQPIPASLDAAVRSARSDASDRVVAGWRLRATPLRDRIGRFGSVVVAVDTRPYVSAEGAVAVTSLIGGSIGLVGAVGLSAIVLNRGLEPIARMTRQASEWSRTHRRKRFVLGPPRDEVTSLAATLDDLLDRVDDAIDTEQRLTAEIAHELRTPLTVLVGQSDLALLDTNLTGPHRDRFERMAEAAARMTDTIEVLLASARATGPEQDDAQVIRVLRASVAFVADPRIAVHVAGDADCVVPVSPARLERLVAPLLHNAVAAADTVVRVQVTRAGADARITVVDDGPGVDPSIAARLFEPGSTSKPDGTGLGLSLSRRLARAAGGDVRLERSVPATFTVTLPAVAW